MARYGVQTLNPTADTPDVAPLDNTRVADTSAPLNGSAPTPRTAPDDTLAVAEAAPTDQAPLYPGDPAPTPLPVGYETHPPLPWWAATSTAARVHPHQVKRRRAGSRLLAAAGFVLAGTIAWTALGATEVDDITTVAAGAFAHKQTNQALIGGCGPVYRFTDTDDKSGQVPSTDSETSLPNYQRYETIVPVFGGYWDPIEGTQRFWDRTDTDLPRPETLLANQRQGDIVVYYSSAATDGEVESLKRVANNPAEGGGDDLNLRVAPWPEERGRMPEGRKIAFATWNMTQTCQQFVPSALGDFHRFTQDHR